MKIRKFKPVYGYGWFPADSNISIEVPCEFSIKATEINGVLLGTVEEKDHILSSKKLELTIRTKGPEGSHYNLRAFDKNGDIELTGFVEAI